MESPDLSKNVNQSVALDGGSRIAATLLWRDRHFLLIALATIALPGVLAFAAGVDGAAVEILSLVATKVLALCVGFRICLRARELLPSASVTPRFEAARYLLIGGLLWLSWGFPLLLQVLPSTISVDAFLPISLVGLFFHFIYFFYPLGTLLRAQTVTEHLSIARAVTRKHRMLPLRVIIPSTALRLIPSALLLMPSVSGEVALWSFLSELSAELVWIVATYLTLGYGMASIPLIPTLPAALPTTTTPPRRDPRHFIESLLSMRVALLLFWIGLFLWFSNVGVLMKTPPAVSVSAHSILVTGNQLKLTVQLVDKQGSLRGFQPINCILAGEQRELASGLIESATLPDGTDVRLGLPASMTEALVTLTFRMERTGADLLRLEDLYLWYRWAKVLHLPMQTATVAEEKPSAATLP